MSAHTSPRNFKRRQEWRDQSPWHEQTLSIKRVVLPGTPRTHFGKNQAKRELLLAAQSLGFKGRTMKGAKSFGRRLEWAERSRLQRDVAPAKRTPRFWRWARPRLARFL